ncbi:hypothetical protein BJ741DRAFT_607496 [Chytriomyces cf. hyalinus JEL632]|nr:hypothetical protein BJ741DRAFT_607496 [Chytriomyces cf. hyalinus JEL632]
MATAEQTQNLALLNGAWVALPPCISQCFVDSGISYPVTWSMVYDTCNNAAKVAAIETCIPVCKDAVFGPLAASTAKKACAAFTPESSPKPVVSSATTGDVKPTSDAEKPTSDAEKPTSDAEKPTSDAEKPTSAAPASSSSEAPVATEKPGYEAPAATKPAVATNLYSSASAVVGSIASVFAAAALF